jgi:hypothetical protein
MFTLTIEVYQFKSVDTSTSSPYYDLKKTLFGTKNFHESDHMCVLRYYVEYK